jgi:hypothetical protein
MTLFKGTVFGVGSLVVLAILWRLVVGAFVVGVVLFKLVVFVILPIVLMIWLANKLLRNSEPTASDSQ